MSIKDDHSFVRGFAACLANAVSLESWNPDDIGGGFTIRVFEEAGVAEWDLKILRKAMQ